MQLTTLAEASAGRGSPLGSVSALMNGQDLPAGEWEGGGVDVAEAPPVVAVVVTRNPGPWLEHCLASLDGQDYAALSVVVVDVASSQPVKPRVAGASPTSYLRRLEADGGYAAAINEGASAVQGASFLLLCHDDIALEPTAVRSMVGVAFRANAGIVGPKLVDWDDPERLLAVGEGADWLGRAVPLVESGELDQSQHDGEREVATAPSACMLVRADLFERLSGMDPALLLGGEDLDLCWRARVAGARTVTAPQARVAHRRSLERGERTSPLGDAAVLAARGRMRTALVTAPLLRAIGLTVLAAGAGVVEGVAARALRRRDLAPRSLTWCLAHLGGIRSARRRLAKIRTSTDAVARSPLSKSAGLRGIIRAVAADEDGEPTIGDLYRRAVGVLREAAGARSLGAALLAALVLLLGTRGLLGNPIPAIGTIADPPKTVLALLRPYASGFRLAGTGGSAPAPVGFALVGLLGALLVGHVALAWTVLVLGCFVVGVVGAARLARPIGSRRASAATMLLYLAVPVPYDALATGRLAGLAAYAGAPHILLALFRATGLAPFGARAEDETGGDGLHLAEARGLARRGRSATLGAASTNAGADTTPEIDDGDDLDTEPLFRRREPSPAESRTAGEALVDVGGEHALDEIGAFDDGVGLDDLDRARARRRRDNATVPSLHPPPVTVRTSRARAVMLGLGLAILVALAPVLLPAAVVVVVLLALVVGPAVGDRQSVARAALVGAAAIGVAVVLLAPWSLDLLRSAQWSAFTGAQRSVSAAPSFVGLLAFDIGPTGRILGLALIAPILLAVAIGRGWRREWALRGLVLSLGIVAVTWVSGRGWTGLTAIEPGALLPFAAAPLALGGGLGAAAFDVDLPGFRFGWRQVASIGAGVAGLIACVPLALAVPGGRWHAPARGDADALSWMGVKTGEGPFKVLWLGRPDVLPVAGWFVADDLAVATSRNGAPTLLDQWAGPRRHGEDVLAAEVVAARRGDTAALGHLLAPFGVRYIVVVDRRAPTPDQPVLAPPPDIVPSLAAQVDLRLLGSPKGLKVFENDAWAPARSQIDPSVVDATRSQDALAARGIELGGATAVLAPSRPGSQRFRGPVKAGPVLLAEAPSRRWSLDIGGRSAPRHGAFGVANLFEVDGAGIGTLRFSTPLAHTLALLIQLGLWAVALVLVAREAIGSRLAVPLGRGPGIEPPMGVGAARLTTGWERRAAIDDTFPLPDDWADEVDDAVPDVSASIGGDDGDGVAPAAAAENAPVMGEGRAPSPEDLS